MKLYLTLCVFAAQVNGRIGQALPKNLHDTGYDHGHLDAASCEDKDEAWETDRRGYGCAEYVGYEHECGRFDDFDFVAHTLCCACNGGLQEDVQVTGWGVLDPSLVG